MQNGWLENVHRNGRAFFKSVTRLSCAILEWKAHSKQPHFYARLSPSTYVDAYKAFLDRIFDQGRVTCLRASLPPIFGFGDI